MNLLFFERLFVLHVVNIRENECTYSGKLIYIDLSRFSITVSRCIRYCFKFYAQSFVILSNLVDIFKIMVEEL